MCGIAGIFNRTNSKPIALHRINRMTSIISHRGPDEAGVYLDDNIALGHARLSIIDLAGGSQPIYNETKTKWIIFNGEIYNYPELRSDLIKQGHEFYTTSDTEVILHLYEEKGAACLKYLNGQFSIAIWDSENKELFLARDRVGIRPLFYTFYDGDFIFASEIKSIFTNEFITREIDPETLDQIFTFWANLDGKTFFKGILELPPGHYLKISNQSFKCVKFWDLPFYSPDNYTKLSENDIVDKIEDLLFDSIKIRLRADVPVGTYLSGGLDSSGVTAIVKKNFNNQLRTFGIRFEEQEFDEGTSQDEMVKYLKSDHTQLMVPNQLIAEKFADVIWHCEKPLLRTSPVPLYLLSDTVNRSGFKVVLTGEGADEVFAGYNIFREAKVRKFWAQNPSSKIRPLLLSKLYPYVFKNKNVNFILESFFKNNIDEQENPFFSHMIRWKNTMRIKTFLSQDLKNNLQRYNSLKTLLNGLPKDFDHWDYLSKAQYLEMSIFLSNYLLSSQGDRVAMAHSVEIRLPYLDYRIINFMGQIPANQKLPVLNEKSILKKVLSDVLPENIVRRPKHPYRAPIKQSLLNNALILTSSAEKLKEALIFDEKKVGLLFKKLEKYEHASEFDSMALTGILSTQLIYDQFIKNFSSRSTSQIPFRLIFDKRSQKN